MSLNFDREEVEILKWLKSYPNDLKTVPEFRTMFEGYCSKTEEEFQNVFEMLELEHLIFATQTKDGETSYAISREGLVALRQANTVF